MPQLREHGGNNGACPDATTVLAVIEGEADEWLRHAYAQHLAQCSACLDLDGRLRNFDRPVLADEKEWQQTEKRLDNWMGALLDAKHAAAPPALAESKAAPVGVGQSRWRPSLLWKLSLATAFLALVAVGVDVYLRLQPPVVPPTANTPPPPPLITPSFPVVVVPTPHPMADLTTPPLPSEVQKQGEATTVAKGTAQSEPQQRAALEPPPAPRAPVSEPRTTAPEQATTTIVKPRPSGTEAAAIAESSTPTFAATTRPGAATTTRPTRAFTMRPGAATGPAMENVAAAPVHAQTPDAQAPSAAANPPASLQLASGARLWLALDSFSFQADGRVVFHGSLLLPLNSTGSSALDHGTEVSGFVTSPQGQTSVLLSEIVIRGSHYKLKSQAGSGNARTAGSGGTVQFDSGKVLEMWVSSDSIYERATTESQ